MADEQKMGAHQICPLHTLIRVWLLALSAHLFKEVGGDKKQNQLTSQERNPVENSI